MENQQNELLKHEKVKKQHFARISSIKNTAYMLSTEMNVQPYTNLVCQMNIVTKSV